jgi:hypothetical protein
VSYRRSQLSPQISTRGINFKIAVRSTRSFPSGGSSDAQFLQSWLECDSDLDQEVAEGGINWGAISGLALAIVVSATFWTGIAWAVARIWK